MTREEYISYKRNGNRLMIMFKHYVQCFDEKKHSPFLSVQEFAQYIQMWEEGMFLDVRIIDEYDIYFNIVTLYDNKGQFINFL